MTYSLRFHILTILGTSVGLNLGCGGAAENKLRKDLTDNVCTGDDETGLLRNLNPAQDAQALALRSSFGSDEVVVLNVSGSCDTFDQCPELPLPEQSGWSSGDFTGDTEHIVAYQTSGPTLHYDKDDVLALLGTVDTPQEARLLLHIAGHRVPCDDNNYQEDGSSYVFYTETGYTCGGDIIGHLMRVAPDGTISQDKRKIVERGEPNCNIGRLPHGLLPSAQKTGADLGAHLAQVAYLEAASVAAFDDLAVELAAHSAPQPLILWAQQCSREEQRHAVYLRALARKYGTLAEVPEVARAEVRSLFQMACDNAREGLTRETFGALLAAHQARYAQDLDIRRVMAAISEDEMRHAEFSLELHQFLMEKLTNAERAEVERVRHDAVVEFFACAHLHLPVEQLLAVGLPTPEVSEHLFSELFSEPRLFAA